MGGGAGVSLHGSHSIGTENLQFAMPETKIGFHPDIGASYFLNQCPGKTGYYLGLTGNTIDGIHALELGLITHIVPKERLTALETALIQTSFSNQAYPSVTEIIHQFSTAPESSSRDNPHRGYIDTCFNQDSIENILAALQRESNAWCNEIAQALMMRSPMSLKVTFEQLKRSTTMHFDDIMQMDFDITKRFLQCPDFYEGIRTAVIDKAQSPKWQPKTLSEIKDSDVEAYFKHNGQLLT